MRTWGSSTHRRPARDVRAHRAPTEGFCLMNTVLTALVVWLAVSVLVGVGFSLGAALGYRRGFAEARTAADGGVDPTANWEWTDRRVFEGAVSRPR